MNDAAYRIVLSLVVATVVAAAVGGGVGTVGASGTTNQQMDCSYPVVETDATGTEVTVEEPPETVVTLGPSAAQTMWEIGAEEKVVGMTKYASYLEGADSRANVSGAGRSFVVVEKVVEIQPDLVIAPNIIQNDTVEKLRDAGLTVYRFPPAQSMDDIKQKTRMIGRLVGTCDGATASVESMNESLALVEDAVEGQDEPRVLYYMGGGYTAGEGTFIDTIIETAGGTNIAAEAGISGYQQISSEVVVQQNPAVIVIPGGPQAMGAVSLPKTSAYNNTAAVKNDKIVSVNNDYMNQPAPRTIEVVNDLAKAFHPDAYEEALAAQETTTTTTTTTATETTTATTVTTADTADETTAEPTTETATETPGVGIVGVLLALLLVTLFARYR